MGGRWWKGTEEIRVRAAAAAARAAGGAGGFIGRRWARGRGWRGVATSGYQESGGGVGGWWWALEAIGTRRRGGEAVRLRRIFAQISSN